MGLNDCLDVAPAFSQPVTPAMTREAFQQLLAFEKRDEDRRLPVAAGFFIFLFGVGCGTTWTFILSWFF